MSEFEPLALDSTEVAVVNALIRREEHEFFRNVMHLFRCMKGLADEFGIDMPDLKVDHITPEFFRHDTFRENRSSDGAWKRRAVNHIAKDLAETCEGLSRADAIIGDLTSLKLRLFGDVDFPGGAEDVKAIEKAQKDNAKAAVAASRPR